MHPDDTIVAISTPPGRGGIGVVRFSGADSARIAAGIIRLKSRPDPWRATMGHLVDDNGDAVDEVVVTFFQKPHSYTAEDVVEVGCHGSPVVLKFLLERAIARGARLAEPGEFTMRAFLNGRIDLAQAEAVRDLIEAQTLYQAKVAAQQVGGSVARHIAPIKKDLVDLIALLEAGIDFAEDDVSVLAAEEILERIARVGGLLDAYAASFRMGRVVQQGLTLAIVGRPNVGKSSLFNRLAARERAIVTAAPGTTRDLVTESISLDGIPLHLVDTAGIRPTSDEAESIGVRKSWEAVADSDLTLVVLDAGAGLLDDDRELLEHTRERGDRLVVWNKTDLRAQAGARPAAVSEGPARRQTARDSAALAEATCDPEAPAQAARDSDAPAGALYVSALTGDGIGELRRAILDHVVPGMDTASRETAFLTNIRHERLLRESLEALDTARAAVAESIPHEMLLLDLYNALRPLDAITGQTTADDILNHIFSSFCIGK